MDVASDGTPSNRGGFTPIISADGRFVVFISLATNLTPGESDDSFTSDVFVRDRLNGTTERASVAVGGTQPNGNNFQASVSGDGRYVAFASDATNLVVGDTNARRDVFVRDRVAGTNERVSVAAGAVQANDHSLEAAISGDGRYVAFASFASNLVQADSNGVADIFVHDRVSRTTERASVTTDGLQSNGSSSQIAISSDGQFVVFASSSNLVAADTNGFSDIYVRDRLARTTEVVSVASEGTQGDAQSDGWFVPAISASGQVVAFSSGASNLVAGDTNNAQDIFVHERGARTLATSLTLNGSSAYGEAPHHPELNPADWTFEVWFKDANPTYNHARARILTKGDIASAEVPFFASIDSNLLYVGLRSGGAARTVTFNLASGGITPNAWHHLAASFQAGSRTLTIYIDGVQRAQGVLASTSAGNTLPLIVGKSGAAGDYWKGKLDDLRIWNVARTSAQIQENYRAELGAAPAGLVGNWRFNEGGGNTAFDSAGAAQKMSLLGGATFAADIPQGSQPTTPTATGTPGSPTPTSTPTATATPTATTSPTRTATPASGTGNSSLLLNGTTAYAEAAHHPELNPANWTFELWFKDENPTYNHPRRRILTKGDITAPEVPYFASIDANLLYVGLRTGGSGHTVTFNLAAGGITPNAWHHLAATFNATTRVLTIYIDGVQRAQGVLGSASAGNTLPLIVGRSGTGGDYWKGKVDDLRLWNVVRTTAEIQADYRTELSGAPAGLVGNWRFNEGGGNTALDSVGAAQNMSLVGGVTFSGDVP